MPEDVEAKENLKQICIREEQSDKYWNYAGCYINGGQNHCLVKAAYRIPRSTSQRCGGAPRMPRQLCCGVRRLSFDYLAHIFIQFIFLRSIYNVQTEDVQGKSDL